MSACVWATLYVWNANDPVLLQEVERKDFPFLFKEKLCYRFEIGERIWSFGQQMHLFASVRVCVGARFVHQYYIWLIQHFYINLVTQEISVKMCALTITRLYHAICLPFKVTRQMLKITFVCFGERKHLKLCLHHPPHATSHLLLNRCPFRATSSLNTTLPFSQKFWIIFVFRVRVYFFRRHRLLLLLQFALSTSFEYLTFTVKHFHFATNYDEHTDNSRNFLLRCVCVRVCTATRSLESLTLLSNGVGWQWRQKNHAHTQTHTHTRTLKVRGQLRVFSCNQPLFFTKS